MPIVYVCAEDVEGVALPVIEWEAKSPYRMETLLTFVPSPFSVLDQMANKGD
jgi:hypothetical protein